jgi:preprotein translocase subunit SecG
LYTFILIIHSITCVLLILIVLLQAGKSFGLSGLMGGGSSEAILTTAAGNTLLKKITAVLALIFLTTSFSLTFLTSKRLNKSLLQDIMPPAPTFPVVGNTGTTTNTSTDTINTTTSSVQQTTVTQTTSQS